MQSLNKYELSFIIFYDYGSIYETVHTYLSSFERYPLRSHSILVPIIIFVLVNDDHSMSYGFSFYLIKIPLHVSIVLMFVFTELKWNI